MSATQRHKGQRGEREFCAALRDHLGEALTRQLGSERDGGPDLLIGETWAVEIKRGERLRLADWWQQACAQAADCSRWPALAYRPNRQPWQVIVPLDIVMWGYPHWENTAAADYTATLGIAGFAAVIRETRST